MAADRSSAPQVTPARRGTGAAKPCMLSIACGGFGRHRDDLHRARRHVRARLERVQAMAQAHDIRHALRLGQHDAGQAGADDGGQVGHCQAAVQRVDAHEQAGPQAGGMRGDELACGGARDRLARLGHGVLQVEDQHVGRRAERLGEFALVVGRHEEQRTQFHDDAAPLALRAVLPRGSERLGSGPAALMPSSSSAPGAGRCRPARRAG